MAHALKQIAFSVALSFALCAGGAQAQTGVVSEVKQLDAASSNDPVQQKLRGLTGAVDALDKTMDKPLDRSLLVTPGVHPTAAAVPLAQVTEQLPAKFVRRDINRGKFTGWLVTVVNNSDRPVLFDGDAAELSGSQGPVACVSIERLAALSILPEQSPDFKKKFLTDTKATLTAAVTVGWAQTIHDQKKGSGPIVAPDGGRYGLDEQRREDNLRRFGKRVLWPGDSTSGVIYFDSTANAADRSVITMPVASYYDKADQSQVKFLP